MIPSGSARVLSRGTGSKQNYPQKQKEATCFQYNTLSSFLNRIISVLLSFDKEIEETFNFQFQINIPAHNQRRLPIQWCCILFGIFKNNSIDVRVYKHYQTARFLNRRFLLFHY